MKEGVRSVVRVQVRMDLTHAVQGWRADQIQDGLRGTMEMRKTCRWLGCAALLCFTAVELSGCTTKPLISGFKLPGRKDRDAAVAKSEKKLTAEESEELLAQAREFEKAGDFTSASRVYREYLNAEGVPVESSRRTPSRQVAKSETTSPDQKSLDKSADSDERLARNTAQSKPFAPSTRKSKDVAEVTADPWADEPIGRPDSQALPVINPRSPASPSAKLASASPQKQALLDEGPAPAETPEWADLEFAAEPATDVQTLASDSSGPKPREFPEEDLEDILDLNKGELPGVDAPQPPQTPIAEEAPPESSDGESDWGNLLDQPHPIAAEETLPAPAETIETPTAGPFSELPLVDLSADAGEVETPSGFEEEGSPAEEAPDMAWESHEPREEPTSELALIDPGETTPPTEAEFAPPVLSEAYSENEPAEIEAADREASELLSLSCKDCEPWLYAQVVKLGSPEADIRKEGLTHLADMGSTARQASLAVRTLLQDSDPLVQAHAAWALWVIENDPWDSVTTLRPLLDHSNADVVELACYMLGDIGPQADSATDALKLLRDHADGTLRVHAAEALIRIQGVDDKSLGVLTNALKSRVSQERWIAAVALGRCRGDHSESAVTALTAALKDVDPEVRSAAALSLGGLGKEAEKASLELERVAHMDDPQVRDAARAALACLKR